MGCQNFGNEYGKSDRWASEAGMSLSWFLCVDSATFATQR